LHALRFKTPAGTFMRTYRLESAADDGIAPFPISLGRIARREADPSGVVTLRFKEVVARQLLWTVIDNGEAPLDILEPSVLTASRQLVMDPGAAAVQPLRLYYGNPNAPAPDYDLKAELLHPLDESVPRLALGPQQLNPSYEAPPVPLYERAPWLIYVFTAAASLALLAILRSLVFDVGS
jgi:hypothetical protein